MKKIYVWLFVTAGIILSANAQPFKKGDKLLGGSIAFLNQNRSSAAPVSPKTSTVFSVTPSLGFFTSPKQLFGVSLSYTYDTYKYDNFKQVRNGVGAGIFKQYWNDLGKNFYFIVEGNVSGMYSKGDTKQTPTTGAVTTTSEQKSFSITAAIVPGISYRISKHLTTDLFFSNFLYINDTYSKNKDSYPGAASREYNTNAIGVGAGFTEFSISSLQFGFRYIIN